MDMATLTSNCTKNNLHDASFSSYGNYSEGIYLHKLAESSVETTNSIIIAPHERLYFGRKKAEEGEIGIFGAEKYFNGGVDEKGSPTVANNGAINYLYAKDEEPVDKISPGKPKMQQQRTPSTHSETSWNSQNALLQNVLRNSPWRKAKKRHGRKSLLARLGCSCACNDKNSVDIDEQFSESKSKRSVNGAKESIENGPDIVDLARANTSRLNPMVMEEMHCKKTGNGLIREDCFTFPILSSKEGNLAIKARLLGQDDDKQRQSSKEVFGSPVLEKKIQAGSDGIHTDVESDASSDLFEIESFKNNANYPYLRRQASHGMSGCVTPTTCYAPSEASIEWSVVTASAADFSAMSDTEDFITSSAAAAATKAHKIGLNAKTAAGKEAEKWRSGILLSCKSHKAVRVAGDAYRTNGKAVHDPRRHHRSDSFGPVTRLQPENQLTGFDSRTGQRGFDAHSLSSSHSARGFAPFVHSAI